MCRNWAAVTSKLRCMAGNTALPCQHVQACVAKTFQARGISYTGAFTGGRRKPKIGGRTLKALKPDKTLEYAPTTWEALQLSPPLLRALRDLRLHRPTDIQQLAFKRIRQGQNVICAAQTGTGKTLAYALPILETMYRRLQADEVIRVPKQPRFLVLTPSQVLALQIRDVIEALAKNLGMSATATVRGVPRPLLYKRLALRAYDILVTTPDSLLALLQERRVSLRRVAHVVVDEADTLVEIRCRQKVEKVLRHCDRGHLQTVLVAATITTSVKEFCDDHVDWLGSVVNVCCGDLHHMPESVSQQFVRVKKTDKFPQLLAVLQSSGQRSTLQSEAQASSVPFMQQETDHDDMVAIDEDQPEDGPDSDRDWDEDRPLLHARISEMPDMSLSERVVIFCNTVQSCNDVSAGLDEYGIVHVAFHGSMAPAQSFANYRSFIDKEVNLMVTTDIAGRGLDVLHVQHVVMYDFPLNLIDYLHRLGRTGRMGQKGRCTCLIPKQVVPLVLKLAALARSGRSLLEIERLSSQKGPGKGRRERGNKTKGQKPPKKVLTRNQKRQKWVVQQRERAIRLGALKQRIRNMNQRTSIRTTP